MKITQYPGSDWFFWFMDRCCSSLLLFKQWETPHFHFSHSLNQFNGLIIWIATLFYEKWSCPLWILACVKKYDILYILKSTKLSDYSDKYPSKWWKCFVLFFFMLEAEFQTREVFIYWHRHLLDFLLISCFIFAMWLYCIYKTCFLSICYTFNLVVVLKFTQACFTFLW